MAEYTFPPHIAVAEIEWRLADLTGRFSSPLSGAVRTVSRGQRWACAIKLQTLASADRHYMQAWLAAIRGGSSRIWIADPSATFRGSFAAPELVTNGSPIAATTDWTTSNAELVLSADSLNGLRLSRTGVTGDRTAQFAAVTTVASAPYALRWLLTAGRGNVRAAAYAGTSAGASGLLSGTTRATAARYVEALTPSGTTTHVSVADFTAGRSAGAFQFVSGVSLARCGLVNGASQTGVLLIVDGLPASTSGLARAGDMFEVGGELKRLTADVDTDGSGNAALMFEPALRSAPADNVPVIFTKPAGRFVLADDAGWQTRPGLISDLELSFVEA